MKTDMIFICAQQLGVRTNISYKFYSNCSTDYKSAHGINQLSIYDFAILQDDYNLFLMSYYSQEKISHIYDPDGCYIWGIEINPITNNIIKSNVETRYIN